MNKKLVIGLVILSVLALGFSVYNFTRPVKTEVIKEVGSMPGNELPGSDFTVNGVKEIFITKEMNKATTTLCVVRPADRGNATTSLINLLLFAPTGTGTAATLVAATSTSAYSTSTASNFMSAQALAADAKLNLIWSQATGAVTPAAAGSGIIGPNDYVLVKSEGVGLSGYTYDKGTCKFKFIKF